ncbi:RNA polymerase sigma factor [bacterium]|nr:RNA polymerase sigma factor [bacterium]
MQESDIIALCRKGEMEGYRLLYERFARPLLHTGLRMLGNSGDAEDAVQETFVKVYRAIGGFRGTARFSTWLFRIHMRVCLDMMKKRRPAMQLADTDRRSPVPDYELTLALKKGVDTLPRQQKACFVLYAVEGFRQQEIGEILGIETGTVKAHIHHAKQRLRSLIERE